MTKAELRKIYLAKQRELSPDERSDRSRRIAELFFLSFDLSLTRVLHTFIPIEKFKEVDTRLIIDRIWNDYPQIQIALPRVDFETNQMANVKFGRDVEVVRNSWDIYEPTHNDFVAADEIDMVLVPGLCFDGEGHRVGYGKGFYDRFLKNCREDCLKIGLSYFDPVDKIDDVHEGDVRLDLILTTDHIHNSQNRER
jgi:5-formyltetrahydrofolate cyclo-ligase